MFILHIPPALFAVNIVDVLILIPPICVICIILLHNLYVYVTNNPLEIYNCKKISLSFTCQHKHNSLPSNNHLLNKKKSVLGWGVCVCVCVCSLHNLKGIIIMDVRSSSTGRCCVPALGTRNNSLLHLFFEKSMHYYVALGQGSATFCIKRAILAPLPPKKNSSGKN